MKKFMLFLMIIATFFVKSEISVFGLDLENLVVYGGYPQSDADINMDGYNDLVFDTTQTLTSKKFLVYFPDISAYQQRIYIQFYDGTVQKEVILPNFVGFAVIDMEEFGIVDWDDIDRIRIVVADEFSDIEDSLNFDELVNTITVSEDETFVSMVEHEVDSTDLDYERGYANGRNSIISSWSDLLINDTTPVDGYDDDSFDAGILEGYANASIESGGSMEWLQTFFSLFDVIFSIELLPNFTIGVLLGISVIPPVVIGVIKWLS